MPNEDERVYAECKVNFTTLNKDIDHLKYMIIEQDKETEFLKTHISSKHKEQCEKVQKVNDRMDTHIATETKFQQKIHKEILDKFAKLDVRMSTIEKWKAVIYGGIITIVTLIGYILQGGVKLK